MCIIIISPLSIMVCIAYYNIVIICTFVDNELYHPHVHYASSSSESSGDAG